MNRRLLSSVAIGFALAGCNDDGQEMAAPGLTDGDWAAQAAAAVLDNLQPDQYAVVDKSARSISTYAMGEGQHALRHINVEAAVKDMDDPIFQDFMRIGIGMAADGDDPDCAISGADIGDEDEAFAWNSCVRALMQDDDCAIVALEYIRAEDMYHAHCLA